MSAAQKRPSPEQRAWEYLKEVMRDDEKWGALKRGECVEVTGSAGGKYFLYPNGHVVRLGKEKAILGKFWKDGILPYPDVLCTMYAWITMAEKEFLKNWGCGNISVEHRGVPHEVMSRLSPSTRRALENIEEDEEIIRGDGDGGHDRTGRFIILPVLFVCVFGFIMFFVMFPAFQKLQITVNDLHATSSPSYSPATPSPSSTNSGLADDALLSSFSYVSVLLAIFPIFAVFALIISLTRRLSE